MSIPTGHQNEYSTSSLGGETVPQSIIVKNSMWSVFFNSYKLTIKEFEGDFFYIPSISGILLCLTRAKKLDGSIYTDRFWVWSISFAGYLILYEIEPFSDKSPTIHYTKNITNNAINVDVEISQNDYIRAITLKEIGGVKKLYAYTFLNIYTDTADEVELDWSSTRTDYFSNYVESDKTELIISYSDATTPPNVYTTSYTIPVPTNFQAFLTGLLDVTLTWDAMPDVENYVIQRDTNPGFISPVYTYNGSATTDLDTVPISGVYYYRIKSQKPSIGLESPYSSAISIDVSAVDFVGVPRSGERPLSVQFTDLSTTSPTEWLWQFGDGDISIEQNPLHVYTMAGVYTVSLTAGDGVISVTEIKTAYITVYEAGYGETEDLLRTYDIAVESTESNYILRSYGLVDNFIPKKGASFILTSDGTANEPLGFKANDGITIIFD